MKKKRINQTVAQWLFPVAVLLVLIIILEVQFSVSGQKAERKEVENRIITEVSSYTEAMERVVHGQLQSSSAIASCIALQAEKDVDVKAALGGLCDASDSYEAILCDRDGKGYLSNGDAVDIGGMDYFNEICTGSRRVAYIGSDGITGAEAFVTMAPVVRGGTVQAYVISYFDKSMFEEQIKAMNANVDVFYILMKNTGEVVMTTGHDTDTSVLCADAGDYYEFLETAGDNEVQVGTMKYFINNQGEGIIYCSAGEDARGIVYVPVAEGLYYLVAGFSEDYIAQNVYNDWKEYGSVVWHIMGIMFLFIAIIVAMNIITRIRDKEKHKALVDKADTDMLTELYNKMATERKIKEYIEEYPNQPALMFVLDIDNFKKINDTMGHAFGDEVLRTLGARIKSEFRATDIVGRTGGDEFIIFLRNMSDENVIKSEAERIERFFKDFQAGTYVKYSATASIGAAVFPRDAGDFEGLYKAADHALYVAKKRGKNQMAFYGDDK